MSQLSSSRAAALLGITAFLTIAGCRDKKDAAVLTPTVLAPAKASAELEKAFAAPGVVANTQLNEQAKIAQQALAQGNTELAYSTLQQLKAASASLSPRQDMAVRNAILGLIHQTIGAAAAGDPKAKEMVNRMQQMQ